jgi:DNA replication protein DnaC
VSTTKNQLEADESICPKCFGTGTHYDREKNRATLCECQRTDPRKNLLTRVRIPERYVNCSFDNFKTDSENIDNALSYARTLSRDYPAVDRGLLFMGGVGVGKTHLAVSILKTLTQRGFRCLFCEFGSLLKQIQASYNPVSKTSELGVLAPIYQADVLVLDELGAAIPTDWVRDTMYQIINKRYNDRKLTIFTTNYLDMPKLPGKEEKDETEKSSKERIKEMTTLAERIGNPLRSRLHEMCTKVEMEGEDYRTHMGRRRFDVSRS